MTEKLRKGHTKVAVVLALLCAWLGLFSVRAETDPGFERDVLPILRAKCLPCHDAHTQTSGFSVQDRNRVLAGGAKHGPAVRPGLPEKSPLVHMLRGRIQPRMPLQGDLSESEIRAIEAWIRRLEPEAADATSAEPPYWAFVSPSRQPPPDVENRAWVRNGVDRFILRRLEDQGLTPAPEANRRVLLRRLYFDLIGLPPSPEEMQSFMRDESAEAYQELVDRLLADPRYGERWARYWLDLARYSDTNGYEGDAEYPHAWRYREYVIDAFNNDKPYDEFVKEQIAGDEFELEVFPYKALPVPDPEKVVALTFLRLAPFTEPRGEEDRDVILSEITSTVGSVFLGLTVGCAKCHDHKYDRIPTRDFYRLKAFFAAVAIARPYPDDIQQLGGSQPAEFYRPGEQQWADGQRASLREQLEEVEAAFADFHGPLLDRLKDHRKSAGDEPDGGGGEATLKDLEKAIREEDEGAADGAAESLFSSAERRRFSHFSRRIRRLEKAIQRVAPLAMSLTNAQGPPYGPSVPATFVLTRGHWNRPGERVEPGFPSAIAGHSAPAVLIEDRFRSYPTRFRRLTLANWIASPENPLTARVMVNRLWQYHLGRGIVATPSNFGENGARPTHPHLLDWLALQLIDGGWSLKSLHRLILTSSTYRQSSQRSSPEAERLDPGNQLLWRFRQRRLEAEAIRDSVLAVSSRLNPARGGPPVFPPLPEGLDEAQKVQTVNIWETSTGPEQWRRSLYVYQRRSLSLPLLELFDAPVCNASRGARRHSVTALQALAMYDSEFVNAQARRFADRVWSQTGPDLASRVDRAFQLALARPPTAGELQRVIRALRMGGSEREAVESLCRVLLNSNEFIYVD